MELHYPCIKQDSQSSIANLYAPALRLTTQYSVMSESNIDFFAKCQCFNLMFRIGYFPSRRRQNFCSDIRKAKHSPEQFE